MVVRYGNTIQYWGLVLVWGLCTPWVWGHYNELWGILCKKKKKIGTVLLQKCEVAVPGCEGTILGSGVVIPSYKETDVEVVVMGYQMFPSEVLGCRDSYSQAGIW